MFKQFNTRLLALFGLCLFLIVSCKKDPEPPGPGNPQYDGIEGEWQANGMYISEFLSAFAKVDSIYAIFDKSFSYRMEHFDATGAKTIYEGIYEQDISDTTDYYYIRLRQSSPFPAVSEGIAAVYLAQPDSMYLEIVQTNPHIGALAPTLTGGFGSSSEGALGRSNIQRFRRIGE